MTYDTHKKFLKIGTAYLRKRDKGDLVVWRVFLRCVFKYDEIMGLISLVKEHRHLTLVEVAAEIRA